MECSRASAYKSITQGANSVKGICETLRLIYDRLYTFKDCKEKEEIKELLIDAFIMGKKMADRLVYYKNTYNDTTGHNGKHLIGLTGNNQRKEARRARHEGV
jgi:hypothetical protein